MSNENKKKTQPLSGIQDKVGVLVVNGLEIKVNSLKEYYDNIEIHDWDFYVKHMGYNPYTCWDWLWIRTYQTIIEDKKYPNIYQMMRMLEEEMKYVRQEPKVRYKTS
jgi:hypothetical protein